MINFKRNSHCGYCGTEFSNQETWPRHCAHCANITWSNPLPAATGTINVWGDPAGGRRPGTLIQQRNIEPHKGEWALTGGYIDKGEAWQEALVREVREEIGLETDIKDWELVDVISNFDQSVMIVFGNCRRNVFIDEINFVPNNEVTAIKIVHEPIELAFSSHTEILRRVFK